MNDCRCGGASGGECNADIRRLRRETKGKDWKLVLVSHESWHVETWRFRFSVSHQYLALSAAATARSNVPLVGFPEREERNKGAVG